jgi:dihydroorotate dehydrogenase electron transfer subunit
MEISSGVHLMRIKTPDIAATAQPGQFITVSCEGLVLRRPFSIHQVVIASEAEQSEIALLFEVVGKGTLWLSQRQTGDEIDILGPLGNRFGIESSSRNLLLVAGGIGIAPLVFLAQHASSQHHVTLMQGASTAARLYPILPLPNEVRFVSVTEDGSIGKKGMVTDVLPDFLDWADQIYACGPVDMYKAISLIVDSRQLPAKKSQVSLELRMGCGIGACYGCTINTKRGSKQVCRDGPIFELDEIIWEELQI